MPELNKPDMPAVLERTNLARHMGGFLLPIFEAISNAIHSIHEKFGVGAAATNGVIRVDVSDPSEIDSFSIRIFDNGNGLDEGNMGAFLTPFTGNKLRKNGKGFGRFIAFKVFEDIEYQSKIAGDPKILRFKFDIYDQEEVKYLSSPESFPFDEGCLVKYSSIRDEFRKRWRDLDQKEFLDHVTQNFLTYLVNGEMPKTEVRYNGEVTDLRAHFSAVFEHEETHKFSLDFDGEQYDFVLEVSRVPVGDPFKEHALLFFADNRILGSGRAIQNKMGKSFFEREDGSQYVVIASVSGEYLDKNASNDRTFLEASEADIVAIVDKACSLILRTEEDQNTKIKDAQRDSVVGVLQTHPLLRFGLSGKTVEHYVKNKPNSWNTERFVSDLSIQRYRAERRWVSYLKDTFADEQKFVERKDKLLEQVTETYRDALCEYVVHRRAVIEMADQLRKLDQAGQMSPEDAVHDLIFPRNTDSTTTKYYRHNLWLLDERLSFVSYVSSDRTLHGGRRKAGDKVVDIGFYDEVYVAGGQGTQGVMVVEFKRPGRDDYREGKKGLDPVKQIRDTVTEIRKRKSFVTADGATIDVSQDTLITAYIVADLEPSLHKIAGYHDFEMAWDSKSFFHFHKKLNIYTEVFGYNRLLEDAKKRNSPFFDVLMNDFEG